MCRFPEYRYGLFGKLPCDLVAAASDIIRAGSLCILIQGLSGIGNASRFDSPLSTFQYRCYEWLTVPPSSIGIRAVLPFHVRCSSWIRSCGQAIE